jgi:hypothetical protein
MSCTEVACTGIQNSCFARKYSQNRVFPSAKAVFLPQEKEPNGNIFALYQYTSFVILLLEAQGHFLTEIHIPAHGGSMRSTWYRKNAVHSNKRACEVIYKDITFTAVFQGNLSGSWYE